MTLGAVSKGAGHSPHFLSQGLGLPGTVGVLGGPGLPSPQLRTAPQGPDTMAVLRADRAGGHSLSRKGSPDREGGHPRSRAAPKPDTSATANAEHSPAPREIARAPTGKACPPRGPLPGSPCLALRRTPEGTTEEKKTM